MLALTSLLSSCKIPSRLFNPRIYVTDNDDYTLGDHFSSFLYICCIKGHLFSYRTIPLFCVKSKQYKHAETELNFLEFVAYSGAKSAKYSGQRPIIFIFCICNVHQHSQILHMEWVISINNHRTSTQTRSDTLLRTRVCFIWRFTM